MCGLSPNSLQLHCEVHDVSRAFASTFDGLLSNHVAGIISCALFLRNSGALATFRQSLAEEITERLVIRRGSPSPEAQAHKERVLATMSSAGCKNTPQLTVLAPLPNGDWRSSEIQHYLPAHDVPTDRGLIVKKLVARFGVCSCGKEAITVDSAPLDWLRNSG